VRRDFDDELLEVYERAHERSKVKPPASNTSLRFTEEIQDLPLKFVTQTQAILAKKRVGKSYAASVQAEELLDAGQQIIVIDPTSAWWGLKSSADGDKPGYKIAVFGGEHGDVILEPTAGAIVAEAIVADRFSAILDLSGMEIGEANRFVGEFLRTLYRKNRTPVHVFCDEADMFAPQQPYGDEARTLGAVNNVVRRGGIKGIGFTMITQRPAVISKSILYQCDMLTCLRMHGPADLEQVGKWVKGHAAKGDADAMLASLPSLQLGQAWLWNPEIDLFRKVTIRRRRTFDSGATPEVGDEPKAPVVAEIDLAKLGTAIAATVERVKATDPKIMKQRITELEQALHDVKVEAHGALVELAELVFGKDYDGTPAQIVDAVRERLSQPTGLDSDDKAAIDGALLVLQTGIEQIRLVVSKAATTVRAEPVPVRDAMPVRDTVYHTENTHPATRGDAHHAILATILYLKRPASFDEIALVSGYSAGASTVKGYLSKLRSEMHIKTENGMSALLGSGFELAKKFPPPKPPRARIQAWIDELGAAGKVFEALAKVFPKGMTHAEICKATGMSPDASTVKGYLSILRTKGLIESDHGVHGVNRILYLEPTK
jgi:hypothetical protein